MNQTNGPRDGSVMGTEFHFEASKVGVGVLIWAVINKYELVGPFWVEGGLKQLQELPPVFRRQFPQAVVRKKSASFKKTTILMQDNAKSHAFEGLTDERTMT